uniref:C-type lectin domain-containing protein n=1 Tax=Myripristis murdjan TaxID=586833 RepID=A0A667Y8K8_9TELE
MEWPALSPDLNPIENLWDQLSRRVEALRFCTPEPQCPEGRPSRRVGCHASAENKSTCEQHETSRQDCLERGADLVVINSQDEQKFINSFKQTMWLGLSDRGERGNWTWVDGTRLDTGFWGHGEPGSPSTPEREHCAYTYWYNNLNSWSDDKCAKRRHWICEKLLDF